jgi:hypothetical protein
LDASTGIAKLLLAIVNLVQLKNKTDFQGSVFTIYFHWHEYRLLISKYMCNSKYNTQPALVSIIFFQQEHCMGYCDTNEDTSLSFPEPKCIALGMQWL